MMSSDAAPQRTGWSPVALMTSESTSAYLRVADSEEAITVPEPLWATHPILGRLKELSVSKYDNFFYFDALSEEDLRSFATMRFYSQDPDSSRFERMYPCGIDRDFSTVTGIIHAALWFGGRVWDERWTVEIPRELEDQATSDRVTDLAAGTLSNIDRHAFLRRKAKDESLVSIQRARWEWPTHEIVAELTCALPILDEDVSTDVRRSTPAAATQYYEADSGRALFRWIGGNESRWGAEQKWIATDVVSRYRMLGEGWLTEITDEEAQVKYPKAFYEEATRLHTDQE